MIPRQRPGQSFEAHQDEMAAWMGYPDRDALNAAHDRLHASFCKWLGVESRSLRIGRGERLSGPEAHLAGLEEEAVLMTQRFICQAGLQVPK